MNVSLGVNSLGGKKMLSLHYSQFYFLLVVDRQTIFQQREVEEKAVFSLNAMARKKVTLTGEGGYHRQGEGGDNKINAEEGLQKWCDGSTPSSPLRHKGCSLCIPGEGHNFFLTPNRQFSLNCSGRGEKSKYFLQCWGLHFLQKPCSQIMQTLNDFVVRGSVAGMRIILPQPRTFIWKGWVTIQKKTILTLVKC